MSQIVTGGKHDKSLPDIGKKQWVCIEALAEYYANVDMSKISATSRFTDDEWDVAGSRRYNFKWGDWLNEEDKFPLLLACKIICHHAIQIANASPTTTQKQIVGFIHAFIDTLQSKSILIAERNQPFNGLSQLTDNDIQLVAQVNLSKHGKLAMQPYAAIFRFTETPLSAFPHSEFMISGVLTPWKYQGISYTKWIEQLKETHGLDVTTKSYPQLEFECVSQLVKSAMPFIKEHFDTIVDVFNEIEKFHKESPPRHDLINLQVGRIIEKKHGKELEKILPIRYEKHKKRITLGWYSQLQRLAQGAASWIILLTTGLRNIDMRNLEKGCCPPSKRHKLLYYLITDIEKSHLKKYILPVPPQTQKAVELAEQVKVDRSGSVLFAKSNTKGVDNTSNDHRKMMSGDPFNKLLKDFANHYGIALKTISDDDKEATAHCVRATLAGYIGTNSTAAILILKKLFGHSNGLMPDAYLNHNPLVISERNRIIANAQKSIAEDIADAVSRGKVSGKFGRQMLEGAEHIKDEISSEFQNDSPPPVHSKNGGSSRPSISPNHLTEMDMSVRLKERLKEVLLDRIKEHQVYALKTPMAVVCMRNCNDSSDAPCSRECNHENRKENGISKLITDALGTLPNPGNCVGKECADALFGDFCSRDLLHSFDYYIKYLQGVGYQSINITTEANNFINTYGSILKDLYGDERKDGYFD